jgi:CRP/FNR family transcriptional regulator
MISDLPVVRALPLAGVGVIRQVLTDAQRRRLASIATRLELRPRAIVYRDGDPADSLFINGGGLVMAFKELPSGRRRVAGFRFQADIFGLADQGRYVNTTRTLMASTVYQIPVDALTETFRQDADLEFQFFCKVIHELRQGQRQILILGRRDAQGRIAMFVDMLRQARPSADPDVIDLPMSRLDMADFVNLAPESVSRACAKLSRDGILAFGRHGARILDRQRFGALLAAG